MGLQATFDDGLGVRHENAYIKVMDIKILNNNGSKGNAEAPFQVFASEDMADTSPVYMGTMPFDFEYGSDPFAQAYNSLKELASLSDVVDAQDVDEPASA